MTIPNSVTTIGEWAFFDCDALTSVTIGNSVTSIGELAFYDCNGLKSVTIGNALAFIDSNIFGDCTELGHINVTPDNKNLSSIDGVVYNKDATKLLLCPMGKNYVTIPNSVTSIDVNAFNNCSRLQTIYMQSRVPVECDPYFYGQVYKNTTLYVPTGTKEDYERIRPWKFFEHIKEMDFSGIEDAEMDATRGTDEPVIRVENGVIKVDNADGEAPVEVFDISGKSVFRACANIVSGLAKGIYIVKVGDKVQKIRL